MTDLVRKSFYIDQGQAIRLAEHIFQNYIRTGQRLTESEVVREALARYLEAVPGAPPAAADGGEGRKG